MPDPTITAYRELEPDDLLTALIARAYPPLSAVPECGDEYGPHGDCYVCTRPKGHDGPHVAYVEVEPVAVWPQEEGS